MLEIKVKKLDSKIETLPKYETEGSAGFDLRARIDEDVVVKAGEVKLIKTGLAFELPEGYEGQIRSRSGLALKNNLFVLNSPGTLDSDYRGEICIILANFGKNDFIVTDGMRLAQMVISKYEKVEIKEVSELSDTKRGTGGFGSTGIIDKSDII